MTELKNAKIHAKAKAIEIANAKRNQDNKSELQGQTIPDPNMVLPAFYQDPHVKEIQKKILEMAEDNCKTDPLTKEEFVQMTNFLLQCLSIKNPHRKEILGKLTVEDFMKGGTKNVNIYSFETGTAPKDSSSEQSYMWDLGEGNGTYRIIETQLDNNSEDAHRQGFILKQGIHKTGAQGAATVFLSLPDKILMDAYDNIAHCFCRENGYERKLESPFFINSKGTSFLRTQDIDYRLFCEIAKISSFTQVHGRKMFAGWANNQKSMQLAEMAAFTANHSEQVQQAHYLSEESKRMRGIVASAHYQNKIIPEAEEVLSLSTGQRYMISKEYSQQIGDNLKTLQEKNRERALQQLKEKNDQIEATPERVITPTVAISLVELIVAIGEDGELGKKINKDILDELLTGKEVQNREQRSLIMECIDFDPSLPQCKILNENFFSFCRMLDEQKTIEEAENMWTKKLAEVLKNLHKKKSQLSFNYLTVLGQINEKFGKCVTRVRTDVITNQEYNKIEYKYNFGNLNIERQLNDYNEKQITKDKEIENAVNTSGSKTATQILTEKRKREEEERLKELDKKTQETSGDDSIIENSSTGSRKRARKVFPAETSVENDNISLTEENLKKRDNFFENIPESTFSWTLQATHENMDTNLTKTPYKTLSNFSQNQTPERNETKSKPFTDQEKISFASLYIDFAKTPFQISLNTTVKDTCEDLYQKAKIESELGSGEYIELKSRFRTAESLYLSICGKKVNNKMRGGLSKGPKKQEPLVYYILEGMEKEYGSNWDKDKNESEKREMLRQIKTKILDKMKEDAGITYME